MTWLNARMAHRLIYVSRITDLGGLKEILDISRRQNHARGVTGAMCVVGGVIMQCLEGELSTLQSLYSKIVKDARHRDAKLLRMERAERPFFKGWDMALLTWTDETKAIFEFFMPEAELDLYSIDADKAITLLRALSQSSNWLVA